MKILLIDAPYDRLQGVKITANYPLGPAYLVSYVKEHGYDARYINLDYDPSLPALNAFSVGSIRQQYELYTKATALGAAHEAWDDFKAICTEEKPDLIGFTATTVKIKSVYRLATIAKEVNPRIVTVLGGHQSHVFAGDILRNNVDIDFIVLGEGEDTFLELLNAIERQTPQVYPSIAGLAFRSAGTVTINQPRDLIADLNRLPFPAPCYYYAGKVFFQLPITALIASRGCPYSCNYCATNSIWRKKVRMRSPQNVVDEIEHILSVQSERYFSFYDDCFTLNKRWLTEFCDLLLARKIRISWQCITSANLLDESVFKKIVKAGCVKINVAIESGSPRMLEIANKQLDLAVVRRVFAVAKKYGISTAAYIMIGLPGETVADIRLTQQIIKEVRPSWVYCNVLIPLPGTAFYDQCVSQGMIDSTRAYAGESIVNIMANYTGGIPDNEFYALVDETFNLCYKINTNIFNLMRRMPIMSYLTNPLRACADLKKVLQYIKTR